MPSNDPKGAASAPGRFNDNLSPESTPPPGRHRGWIKAIVTVVAVAIIVLWTEWGPLLATLRSLNPFWILPALGCVSLSLACIGLRWTGLLRAAGLDPDRRSVHSLVWIGHFFNAFLPTNAGGDAMRVVLLARMVPGKAGNIVASVLLDRLAGMLTLFAIGLPSLYSILPSAGRSGFQLILGAAIFGGILGMIIVMRWKPSAVQAGGKRGVLRRLWEFTEKTALALRLVLRQPRSGFQAIGWSLVIWALEFGAIWMLANGLGLSPGWGLVAAVAAGYTAALLPISLGGHGVREGAFVAILSGLEGMVTAEATALAICWLGASLFTALCGGFVYARTRLGAKPV